MALRLRLRLARKAEGESEDDWGRCPGWRLTEAPAGSGSAGAVGGSRGLAAAQGVCGCYCCSRPSVQPPPLPPSALRPPPQPFDRIYKLFYRIDQRSLLGLEFSFW